MTLSLNLHSGDNQIKIWRIIVLCSWFLIGISHSQQLISPCPKLFQYEPKGSENDRWYGTLTILFKSDLNGVWLRLFFDKPSFQLGNWFGEVTSDDNKDYLVQNPNFKLLADVPYKIRFYIKYNPEETPPRLVGFTLNARTVCPENGGLTTQATPLGEFTTSIELSTTSSPVATTTTGNNVFSLKPPINFLQPASPSIDDDDDFFHGDFVTIFKPNNPIIQQTIKQMDATCGTVLIEPNGSSTVEGEFPWHAALYYASSLDLTYFCGASLVTTQHLITVAHCVTKRKSKKPIRANSLEVYLGKHFLRHWSNKGIQNKHVERVIPHPDYNPQMYFNDIAVIKLTTPAEITNYVRPVCLWTGDIQSKVEAGMLSPSVINCTIDYSEGTVIGWGFDENGKISEQLKKSQMEIVSQNICISSDPDYYSRFTSTKSFCAGFLNMTGCNGDSGSGMVFPKSDTNSNNRIWQIRGLVSISVAVSNQRKCNATRYVVFTDVAKYSEWIRASLT